MKKLLTIAALAFAVTVHAQTNAVPQPRMRFFEGKLCDTTVWPTLNGACVSVETNGVLFQCVPFDRPLNTAQRGERDGRRVFVLHFPKSLHATTGAFFKIKAISKKDEITVRDQTVELWDYGTPTP